MDSHVDPYNLIQNTTTSRTKNSTTCSSVCLLPFLKKIGDPEQVPNLEVRVWETSDFGTFGYRLPQGSKRVYYPTVWDANR